MATIVLVPGFWLGGWAWDRVTAHLKAAGHDVYPVTLTGLAERAGEGGQDTNLDTHTDDLLKVIMDDDLREVVLVGHSGGGMPVTAVIDRVADRIASVVYVDSGPMPDGMSQCDVNPKQTQQEIAHKVREHGDGWRIPVPEFDPAADPTNLAGLSIQDLELMRERCTGQPFGTSTQPLRLTNPARREVPTHLVACTFPLEQVHQMMAEGHPFFVEFSAVKHSEVHPLPTGHWPMFSRPAELAAVLDAIAG